MSLTTTQIAVLLETINNQNRRIVELYNIVQDLQQTVDNIQQENDERDLQRERDAMTEEMAREYYAREERDAVDRTMDSPLLQDRARLGTENLTLMMSPCLLPPLLPWSPHWIPSTV